MKLNIIPEFILLDTDMHLEMYYEYNKMDINAQIEHSNIHGEYLDQFYEDNYKIIIHGNRTYLFSSSIRMYLLNIFKLNIKTANYNHRITIKIPKKHKYTISNVRKILEFFESDITRFYKKL